jgi:LacI family asc operon transcriptional repressor
MTTMLEVAKRAGVSKATVSRVLSGNGYVGEETRARVFQAIEESGYRPNLLARQLATRKSQTLGLVMTNTLYHGSYFSDLLSQAAQMTEACGRRLLLADGKHSAAQEREALQHLLDLRCDAIMIYPRFLSPDEMDAIIDEQRVPVMVLNRRLRKHPSHCIYSDQLSAARDAVVRLIELGHRDIAFVTGALDSPTGRDRLAGYQAALAQHGIPASQTRVREGKWTPACGAQAVASLLQDGVAFSALVASNDNMAIGALKQLHESGIAVPEQVSVIGFDDIPTAPWVIPSLSSVRLPIREMIQETINKLIFMLGGGELSTPARFEGELIVRESVAAAMFNSGTG